MIARVDRGGSSPYFTKRFWAMPAGPTHHHFLNVNIVTFKNENQVFASFMDSYIVLITPQSVVGIQPCMCILSENGI